MIVRFDTLRGVHVLLGIHGCVRRKLNEIGVLVLRGFVVSFLVAGDEQDR